MVGEPVGCVLCLSSPVGKAVYENTGLAKWLVGGECSQNKGALSPPGPGNTNELTGIFILNSPPSLLLEDSGSLQAYHAAAHSADGAWGGER